jgi:hypothetical protein
MNIKNHIVSLAGVCAAAFVPLHAAAISACVDSQNGLPRIVSPDSTCRTNEYSLDWAQQGPQGIQGPQGLPGPQGPAGPQGVPGSAGQVLYVTGGIVPGTSVARAICPPNWRVAGGGAITGGANAGLQQSFPISDNTGLIAWGSNAIGWQAAAEDWGFVQAFVVCVSQ